MSEELLDVAHAGAALDEVGGVGVPQDVGRHRELQAGLLRLLADDELNRLGVDGPTAARGEEERLLPGAPGEGGPPLAEVEVEGSRT